MTVNAVLFDKDGTLIDFDATYGHSTGQILAELADGDGALEAAMANVLDFDRETKTIGVDSVVIAGSLEDIAKKLLPLTGREDITALGNHLNMLYVKYAGDMAVPINGLLPALDALIAMGLPLGVATNDSEDGAHAHLEEVDIKQRFGFIAGYDSGFGAKPGPGMVLAFADHLGIEPETVMMVGDSSHDCEAGQAAGAIAVGVASGPASAQELDAHAHHVLPDITGLPDLINHLNSQKHNT